MAGSAVAALSLDRFQDRGSRRETEARAAIFLGDEYREIARFGQRLHELGRIAAHLVELAPVLARKACAQLAHLLADFLQIVGFGHLAHGAAPEHLVVYPALSD